ncbi:MAG: translocation/assembly module TamB [Thermoanaerobaculaceae bacterium]|nr:translocation/assembly module TamB [Thermoanaerobaculaceae bacterium]
MRRRGVHLSRTTIAFLAVLAMWIGVLAWAVSLLERPAVRGWLAGQLAGRLEQVAGQRVAVGDVRITLLPLRVTVLDLEVGPLGEPAFSVASAEVAPGTFRITDREIVIDHVRVKGVRVNTRLPEGRDRQDAGSWLRVIVKQVEVEDLQVARLVVPAGIVLGAEDLDLLVTGSRRTPLAAAVVRAGSVRVTVPGLEPTAFSLQGWGKAVPGGVEIRRLRLRGEGLRLDGAGMIGGRTVRGEGSAQVDLTWLDRWVQARADLQGGVDLTWRLAVDTDGQLLVEAQARSDRVSAVGFAAEDVDGEITLTPDGIEGSLRHARLAGGDVSGSYRLAALGPTWPHRVALRGNNLTLDGFLRLLGVDAAGMGARFDASAELSWDGAGIKAGRGTAVGELRPATGDVAVAGRVLVTLEEDGALHFATQNVTLAEAPVRWQGTLTLGDWIPTWSIQASSMPVKGVARLLRGWVGTEVLPERLGGTAALDLRLRGPFQDLTVTGDAAVAPVSFGPVHADGLETSLRIGQGEASFEDGVVYVGSGQVTCTGRLAYGSGGALDFELGGRGLPLERAIRWSGVNAPVTGRLAFTARLGGTLDEPRLDGQVDLSTVVAAGVPFGAGSATVGLASGVLTVGSLEVGQFSARASIDLRRREAEVEARVQGFGLEGISPPLARLAGGELDLSLAGRFPFDAPAGRLEVQSAKGARGFVEMDARGVRLDVERAGVWTLAGALERTGPVYAGTITYGVESFRQLGHDLSGVDVPVDGHLTGRADVRLAPPSPAHLDGVVEALDVVVGGERAGLARPARFRIDGGEIQLLATTLVGDRATLALHGVRAENGDLSGHVEGVVPAVLLGLVWPEARPTGRVELAVEVSGTDQAPRFVGSAQVSEGSLQLAGLPGPVTHINGRVDLIPEAVRLSGLKLSFLGGEGTCSGQILLAPRIELDLALQGSRLRWPLGAGLNPVLAGTARLVGPLENLSLTATANLQRTVYTRPLDFQKLVVESVLEPVRARAVGVEPISFNMQVTVPASFEISTEMARLVARGELRVVGTSAQPGLLGRLEALPGGELEVAGVRYELLRGVVTFTDPEGIEPYLDIQARTTVQTFEITVGLVGTLDRMTPTFTSNPALPEMDIISLISVGRRADEAGSVEAGTVASSFLTDQLTSAMTRRARTLLDVDQLRVDPFAATENGSPTARLTVVKQLSRDWTVTLATNLSANRAEVITSRYRLGPGVFLEAARQADGSWVAEVQWQHRY